MTFGALVALVVVQVAVAGGATARRPTRATAPGAVAEAVASGRTAAPPSPAASDRSAVDLALTKVVGGLSSPLFVTDAGDASGPLFVVEKGGRIRILSGGVITGTFLDIHTKVSKDGERGLLGLAFHPDYATNGRFYIDYTDLHGRIAIAVYHRSASDPDKADPTGSVLLRIPKPYSNHNGGMLAFGPDGYLYIGTGDGGGAGDPGDRAQSTGSLLGKLLRIDINGRTSARPYRIPSSNPYVGRTGLDQIWARGLRNPWRFSFDSVTGDLWVGDVGQDRWEEIDRSPAAGGGGRGKNYGWRVMEGKACYRPASGCSKAGKKLPLTVYSHARGCAVTGGYVYRGSEFPDLVGGYLFGDFCSGRIWVVTAAGAASQSPRLLLDSNRMISSFGQGQDGSIYLTDLAGGSTGAGAVYKLVDTTP
jgi:glucose/arabinose dehydrogenase